MISDEAYEDVVFEGEHISIASLPGMYERTIPLYTFSKTYAITGLRLGYIAVQNPTIRERVRKMLFYTVSNTSSLIQYGGVGALDRIAGRWSRTSARSCAARRELFYAGVARRGAGRVQRRAAGRRVLRVSQDRSRPGGRRCPTRRRRSRGR